MIVPKFDGNAHDAGSCGAIFYGSGQSICDLEDGHFGQHSWWEESRCRAKKVYDQPCSCLEQKGSEPGHIHASQPGREGMNG